MFQKSLGILCVVLATGCGYQNEDVVQSDVKIVGGRLVSPAQKDARLQSTVALTTASKQAKGKSFCSGTLIAPRTVLTAAHCVVDEQGRPLFQEHVLVSFGNKVSQKSITRRVIRAVPHPSYEAAMAVEPEPKRAPNDIALVFLEAAAPRGYVPVSLAPASRLSKQVNVYLAGFGVTSSQYNDDTGVLRQVETKLQKEQTAAKRMVTSKNGAGVCGGDSGGPAFLLSNGKLVVAGVTSSGATVMGYCVGRNNFTDARYYIGWIQAESTRFKMSL